MAAIDVALRRAAEREMFRREEAVELWRVSVAAIEDPLQAMQATAILDEAAATNRAEQIVARSRVVDPLLDIRLLLARQHGATPVS